MNSGVVVLLAFVAGAIPFSNLAAHLARGVDLRRHGSGTVSGTALFEVAGFVPLAVAGVLDVAKGAVGPLLAGSDRDLLTMVAAAAVVIGHNWSPFLKGAGGRGISPALGALLVAAPVGAALILASLAAGRLVRHTALSALVADAVLVPLVARVHGRRGALVAGAVLVPLLVKRVAGNTPLPSGDRWRVARERLLFDRDPGPTQR